jgi:hypothetical protein
MNRRENIKGFLGVMSLAGLSGLSSPAAASINSGTFADDIKTYFNFGIKQTGQKGDIESGNWLEHELIKSGFKTARQKLTIKAGYNLNSYIEFNGQKIETLPQYPLNLTNDNGIDAELIIFMPEQKISGDLKGKIALIILPYGRWSSILHPFILVTLKSAITAGAAAVIIGTTGPSGDAIALNTPIEIEGVNVPVAIISQQGRNILLSKPPSKIKFVQTGALKEIESFNLVGKIDKGFNKWLVISSPRSGWSLCAAERGPGVAIWLALARILAIAKIKYNIAFISTSGHEFENLGTEILKDADLPHPSKTSLWVHLGAGFAANDWFELGIKFQKLNNPDAQRVLFSSKGFKSLCEKTFNGQVGLEIAREASAKSAGEAGKIFEHGYENLIAFAGAHRFHHSPQDNMDCVNIDATTQVYNSLLQIIKQI